jgi:hypothetical protein
VAVAALFPDKYRLIFKKVSAMEPDEDGDPSTV